MEILDKQGLIEYDTKLKQYINFIKDEYGNTIFSGTQAEYETAFSAGLIKEGTIVNITDDYDDPEIIESISQFEIEQLFQTGGN